MGKNFIPRLKNVAGGKTLTNRADVKPKKPKPETVAQKNQATKKAEEVVSKTNHTQRDSVTNEVSATPTYGGDMSSTRETNKVNVDTTAKDAVVKNTRADTGSTTKTGVKTTLTPIDDVEDDSDADHTEEHKD